MLKNFLKQIPLNNLSEITGGISGQFLERIGGDISRHILVKIPRGISGSNPADASVKFIRTIPEAFEEPA